ncbi:hypothetical protein BJ741DRAFT_407924 [Chytriomyces cf. hyalinus JEL632]|nr:hypothetical protein BJ741DRAFT_407924 [Chytriomyces cf. hyalinus JEL632]
MSFINLNFWENFIESIAQVMSRALTDDETEKVLTSFKALQSRLKDLSTENLRRLEAEAMVQRPFCKELALETPFAALSKRS